ncbi:DUF6438 domain-containing protein [Pseudoxanthomonas mexicana]
MRKLLAVLATALLFGCKEAPEPPATSWTELQRAISSTPEILDVEHVTTLIPYDSITLDRGPCMAKCHVYSVTFYRDGRATLAADDLSPGTPIEYSGHISLRDFARLAQAVRAAQSASVQPEYTGQWRDDYSATVTVKDKDGSWSVIDYGQVAPYQVWALAEILHAKRMSMEWKRVSQ